MKKKICVITGSRADYGLLFPLLKKIKFSGLFNPQLIVAGMHLSSRFGLTFNEIEADGFKINEKVKLSLSDDNELGISRSIGLGCIGFAKTFQRIKPDLIVVLGDRFEILAAVISAFIARIPIAHIHGGELTEGAMDDAFRHSITKMSLLHFVSTEEYRKRVIQLGESPDRVFNVGALAMDNIRSSKLFSKDELEKKLNLKLNKKFALITFHPSTLEDCCFEKQIYELLKAMDKFKDLNVIFTAPNADLGGAIITKKIKKYVKNNPRKAYFFVSLGRLKYLSLLKHVDIVVGNSSSGIIEAPSFGKPTINIGLRQEGRVRADSIIDCKVSATDIAQAMKKALSPSFSRFCSNIRGPYGDGKTAERILNIIAQEIYRLKFTKKHFYDL